MSNAPHHLNSYHRRNTRKNCSSRPKSSEQRKPNYSGNTKRLVHIEKSRRVLELCGEHRRQMIFANSRRVILSRGSASESRSNAPYESLCNRHGCVFTKSGYALRCSSISSALWNKSWIGCASSCRSLPRTDLHCAPECKWSFSSGCRCPRSVDSDATRSPKNPTMILILHRGEKIMYRNHSVWKCCRGMSLLTLRLTHLYIRKGSIFSVRIFCAKLKLSKPLYCRSK